MASRDLQRAEALGQRVGARSIYGRYQDLVADPDVDVVYVATISSLHRAHADLALSAGKPVLVEKPLALSAAEAGEVVAQARRTGLFCMEAMWMRVQPLVTHAVASAKRRDVGEVAGVYAELATVHPFDAGDRLYNHAAGGGALLDLGIYPAHFAWLLLGEPDRVIATGSLAQTGVDDSVAMQWSYSNGAFAHLAASFRRPSALGGLVAGDRGTIELGPRINRPQWLALTVDGERKELRSGNSGNGYGPEVEEVASCLRLGLHESKLAPLNDTVGVLKILDGVRSQLSVDYDLPVQNRP